jgi:hypothetical protein
VLATLCPLHVSLATGIIEITWCFVDIVRSSIEEDRHLDALSLLNFLLVLGSRGCAMSIARDSDRKRMHGGGRGVLMSGMRMRES